MKTLNETLDSLIPEWTALIKSLKPEIQDDYRASDDPHDDTPAICLTVGFTPESEDCEASWSYQTGDNSYSGGAYSHPYWAVVTVTRRCRSKEIAGEIADQLGNLCHE